MNQVRNIIGRSMDAWLSLECDGSAQPLDVRELSEPSLCDRAEYNKEGPNINIIVFVEDWADRGYEAAAYALTTVWHNTRSGTIFDVDMEINEGRGPYGVCPTPEGCDDGTVDLQNVVTHEVGHLFGIAHSEQSTATMYAVSPPGEVNKRVLARDDTTIFCMIYPPGSVPNECEYTPRNGLDLTCAEAGCSCSAPGLGPDRRAGLLATVALIALVIARRRRR
jgi:MYXO-CTERM domain-containing protein